MAGFQTVNGQIIAPNGQAFIAEGVGVEADGTLTNADQVNTLLSQFPGINCVRIYVNNYDDPTTFDAVVNALTAKGVVVEFNDGRNTTNGDSGGGQGQIFTGTDLSTELNWYSAMASHFINNPYVWFGTDNEPSETDASGNQDPTALSAWQKQTYDAVRSTGNNNPVMLEVNSGGPGSTDVGYDASAYAGMTNTIWDVHYYGWVVRDASGNGYATDQATVNQTLAGIVSEAQAIPGASGTMPVIIGEYGNSTDGQDIDPNGSQVIAAVQSSGLGNTEWSYADYGNADSLLNGDGSLSATGVELAQSIAAAGTGPSVPPVVPSNPVLPASPDDTVLLAGAAGSLVDASSNTWSIVNGTVNENGQAAGYSANVTQLAYVGGSIWQENADNLWWQWNGTGWTGAGTSTSPLPASNSADVVQVAAGGQTMAIVDGSGAAFGDTFALTGSNAIQSTLGDTAAFIQFTGSAGVDLTGGAGGAIIAVSAGTNSFIMGAGPMDITGGTGADSFTIHVGSGFLSIEDFSTAKGDTLTVDASLQSSMQTMSDGTDGTLIAFGGNIAIDLHHVATAPKITFQ